MSSKLKAIKTLKEQYYELLNDPILSLGVTVGLKKEGDLFHWNISLLGPQDTPYGGGLFFLTADFPESFPDDPPEVKFKNQMYHLNVDPDNGHICINTLNYWKKETRMTTVISDIFALFYIQNPKSPYNSDMAKEYVNNRSEFDRKAKEWTQKYASMEN